MVDSPVCQTRKLVKNVTEETRAIAKLKQSDNLSLKKAKKMPKFTLPVEVIDLFLSAYAARQQNKSTREQHV